MSTNQLKRTAAALLAATLVFGTPGLTMAATTQSTTTTSTSKTTSQTAATMKKFPDVAASHWAVPYISKLALLGIVEGNEKGQYQPDVHVTQEQVITMAVRMMGLDSGISSLPASNVGLEVSDYAKPYIQIALEKGLIDFQEEKTLTGVTKWGTKDATREWVAKLTIRAIGKKDEAVALGSTDTKFTDNASISVWAKGYINEAVKLKIVDGMDDGSFKPKDAVTRAQMAAFLSRAGRYMDDVPSKTATGIVNSLDGVILNLVDDYGKKSSYTVSSDTEVYGVSGASQKSTDLKADNRVFLILSDGKVLYAEVMEDQAKVSDTLDGTLEELTTSETAVTMKLKTSTGEAVLELGVTPTITDVNGKGMKLSDLISGTVLQLKRTGSRAKFSTVIVKHIPVNKTAEGVIKSIDLTGKKLSVSEKDTGTVEYPLADNLIYTNTVSDTDVTALRAKDSIRYIVKNDVVSEIIMVTPYVEPSDSGKMIQSGTSTDGNTTYVTIQKADNKFATYALEDKVQISINGIDYAVFDDLAAGDQLKLMLTDDNTVYKIVVTNRSMDTDYLDTIVTYDADSNVMAVKTLDGAYKVYKLSSNTQYVYSGTTLTSSLVATYLVKGAKVDITASSETNVKKVNISSTYEATVVRANSDTNQLTVKIAGKSVTMKVFSGLSVELSLTSSGKLADLPTGSKVVLLYDTTNDAVSRIQVVNSPIYRLTAVDTSAYQLTFLDDSGNSKVVSVASGVKLYNTSLVETSIANLSIDEPYMVSFTGTTVNSVTAAAALRGAITAVDASGGTVTFTDSTGASTTISVGTSTKVKREGISTVYTLSELKKGDRVEIIKDSTGSYTIRVADVLTKSVESYDSSSRTLSILWDSITEQRTYVLHQKAYVHNASGTISASSLTRSDSVNLYRIDGKIIEVEKQ